MFDHLNCSPLILFQNFKKILPFTIHIDEAGLTGPSGQLEILRSLLSAINDPQTSINQSGQALLSGRNILNSKE